VLASTTTMVTGCMTTSLASAAGSGGAPAVALLPVALVIDGALLAMLANSSSGPSGPSAFPSPRVSVNWQDPQNWVASCDGPLLCAEHEEFLCLGSPGNCTCSCEVIPPEERDCIPAVPIARAKGSKTAERCRRQPARPRRAAQAPRVTGPALTRTE
jgi:hypothetical protein